MGASGVVEDAELGDCMEEELQMLKDTKEEEDSLSW